jgi:hypothetical protein
VLNISIKKEAQDLTPVTLPQSSLTTAASTPSSTSKRKRLEKGFFSDCSSI